MMDSCPTEHALFLTLTFVMAATLLQRSLLSAARIDAREVNGGFKALCSFFGLSYGRA